jgi:hypothetical protein
MTSLVGKAQEEDDDFWGGIGADFFGSTKKKDDGEVADQNVLDSEDNDFGESDISDGAADDSFDSDFNKSEEPDEDK